jgi:hypothetical protein
MGLGKTVSTLTAYLDLLNAWRQSRLLVVAPLRVARKVWPDEVKGWGHLHGLKVSRIIGTPQQRWDAMWAPADIYTVNRENLEWVAAQFIEGDLRNGKKHKQVRNWPWDMVVLDESQSFKSDSSARWKTARLLRRMHQLERLVQLTGTPSPNGYMDLWSQIYLLDQGKRLGAAKESFVRRWFDNEFRDNHNSYSIKPHAAAEIQRLVSDVVLTLRAEDYLDIPPVVYNPVRVTLPAPARKQYERMKREFLTEISGVTINAVNAGVACGKLLQLANGAVYHDEKGGWVTLHDEKLDALLETLDNASGPVMIAIGFKHDLQRIRPVLDAYCGKGKTWRVLDTEQDENDWNAGKVDYLVLHPASAGHGLNLQHSGSETIVWFGLTNNLEWFQQLNARLIGGHRIKGKNVVIHLIVAEDTYDEEVRLLLERKDANQEDMKRGIVELTQRVGSQGR